MVHKVKHQATSYNMYHTISKFQDLSVQQKTQATRYNLCANKIQLMCQQDTSCARQDASCVQQDASCAQQDASCVQQDERFFKKARNGTHRYNGGPVVGVGRTTVLPIQETLVRLNEPTVVPCHQFDISCTWVTHNVGNSIGTLLPAVWVTKEGFHLWSIFRNTLCVLLTAVLKLGNAIKAVRHYHLRPRVWRAVHACIGHTTRARNCR